MAKFPVEGSDQDGIIEAINNLLSGPSGLGQNFAGFSSYTPAWLTGNFRVPYSQSTQARLNVAPIELSVSEMLDGRTWKHTFLEEQATPPFANGNNVDVVGVENDYYDGTYSPIGIVECTTTYFIGRTAKTYPVVAPSPGGQAFLTTGTIDISTDANARVTVTGGTDRVFISAQLDQVVSYVATGTDTLAVTVRINRYIGSPNNDPVNPDFTFEKDATIAEKVYTFPGLVSGTGTLPMIETVFTSVIDQPEPAYYWYMLEVSFKSNNGLVQITTDELKLRSISTQVVKE